MASTGWKTPAKLIINGVLYGVSAVIFDDSGKVLMLRRSKAGEEFKSGWEFIKGGLHVGESHLEAAIREINEEAGPIQIEVVSELPKVYYVDVRYRRQEYAYVEKKSIVFHYLSGDVVLDAKEHSEYRWMDVSDASRVCWVEYGVEILNDASSAFNQWLSSQHNGSSESPVGR